MADISKIILPNNNEYDLKDAIHRADKNNPHEVTAKQIGAESIEPDYRITGAAGWYKFLVVPVESNGSRKIVLRLVESYSTVGVAIISMYLNRNVSGAWTTTSANMISSTVINNTDIGFVLNKQDNEVEYYYRKRSNAAGQVLVNILESVARTGGLVDLSEYFETTPVSEFPSNGTYFYPSQDGAGNLISTTYATKTEVNELDAEDVGAIPDTELDGETATESGPLATFETASAQALPSLVVDIDFMQEGSGDPGPTNIRPISGWDEAKIWRTGKNLADPSRIYLMAIGSEPQSWIYLDSPDGIYRTLRIDQLRAGTYTISTTLTDSYFLRYRYTINGSVVGVNIQSSADNYTFTLTDDVTDFGISFRNTSSTVITESFVVQLEIGSTATPYEPYSISQCTIQLGQTIYGGTLDVTNGILTVTMGSVELSDLDWSDSTGTRYISKTVPGMKPIPSGSTLPNLTAEQYRTITWSAGLTNNHDGIAVSNDDNATLLLYKSDSTSEPSGRIVYELTTPIEYTLSPIQVFALLGKNNLWADTGDASVTYRTGKVALLSDVADATEPIQKRIDIELDDDAETVSGAVATFETASTQVPSSIMVNIEPVQAGSGDPSPSNTRLISGWNTVKVWRTGKNLLDPNSILNGYIGDDGAINPSTPEYEGRYSSEYYPVDGVSKVTVGYSAFASGESVWVSAAFYDSGKNFLTRIGNLSSAIAVFDVPSNAKFMRATMRTYGHGNEFCFAALGTSTLYEPYSGTVYPITFPGEAGTVYGGTLDVLKGKLIVDKAIVMLNVSTSQISLGTTTGGVSYASILYSALGITLDSGPEVQSSNYVQVASTATAVEGVIKCYGANFRIYDNRFTDKASAKAVLDNVQVVYPLATPIEYDVGGSIITVFSGQNAVWADTGNISVTYRTGKFALLSDEANAVEPINTKVSKAGDTMTGNLHLGTNGIDRVLLAETSDGRGNIQIYNPSGAKAINMYSLGANAGGEIDVCDAGGNNEYRVAIYANSVDGGIIAIKDEVALSTPAYITKEKVNIWDSCAVISSKLVSLSLSWSGSGPYTQVVTIMGATITAKSMISLQPTAAQISQLITDGVTVLTIENNNGTLTAYAFGATPSIAMVIPCTITEVNT